MRWVPKWMKFQDPPMFTKWMKEIKELKEEYRRKIKIIREQLKYIRANKFNKEEIDLKKQRLEYLRKKLK